MLLLLLMLMMRNSLRLRSAPGFPRWIVDWRYGSAPENSRSLMSHWCGQCWNLSWWKCRQSVSLSICGSFRHIFHLVISIQGLVKMLFRVDIQVDQGVKVLRCWHPVSTPLQCKVLTLGVNTLILQGVDTYQSDTCFGRCQHLPKEVLFW